MLMPESSLVQSVTGGLHVTALSRAERVILCVHVLRDIGKD